jgi:hypothetical protein
VTLFLHIAFYSLLGCVAMAAQDATGTALVAAIGRGQSKLAGRLDAAGDAAKFVMFSYSGGLLLTKYAPWGILGLVPIMLTSRYTTSSVTELANRTIKEKT